MEITELLKKEHEEVNNLFQQFFGGGTITRLVKKMVGSRPPRRRPVATKICDSLDMHMRLEEEVFYPDVRATGDSALNKLVDESQREHAGVKAKIAKARTQFGEEATLDEIMSSIQSDVDHHVREEETEMFPLLHKVMSEHKLAELGRRYVARKRASKGGQGTTAPRSAGTGRKTASAGRGQASRTTAKRGRKAATLKLRKTTAVAKRKTSSRSKSASAARRKTRSAQKRARGGRGR